MCRLGLISERPAAIHPPRNARLKNVANGSEAAADLGQKAWDAGKDARKAAGAKRLTAPRPHPSHRGIAKDGIATTFDQARDDFEQAWRAIQPKIDESVLPGAPATRARTAWKYAMHDAGAKLPTELASGQSKCFCGAELTAESISDHVLAVYMDMREIRC
jgi:hypothetical protein